MKHYDLIVIGTGAGTSLVEAGLQHKKKVALVEKGQVGGTCLNRGCTPTKVLATAANDRLTIRRSGIKGEIPASSPMAWPVVKEAVVDRIGYNKRFEKAYKNIEALDFYKGLATFTGNKTLKVSLVSGEEVEISADKIVINVGAHTMIPKIDGLEKIDYITSESFFKEVPEKPYKDIIILGGGPIGCEFAHIFEAFGAKVQLVQHNVRLLPKADEEMSAMLLKFFKERGIKVYLNKETPEISIKDGKKALIIEDRASGERTEILADDIFISPGVRPEIEKLGLENTNIKQDRRGYIMTNEFLETSVDQVYAVGDINGQAQFRHKANYEAETLVHNLFLAKNKPEDLRWASYDLVPAVTFTYPEVSSVGMTEAQAKEAGHKILVGRHYYAQTVKGYAMGFLIGGDPAAFAKVIVDKDSRDILGLHVIGPEASNLIQPFANLMQAGKHTMKPINEEIASPASKEYRKQTISRDLDPHKIDTVLESMTPHPALTEVVGWIGWFLKDQ